MRPTRFFCYTTHQEFDRKFLRQEGVRAQIGSPAERLENAREAEFLLAQRDLLGKFVKVKDSASGAYALRRVSAIRRGGVKRLFTLAVVSGEDYLAALNTGRNTALLPVTEIPVFMNTEIWVESA